MCQRLYETELLHDYFEAWLIILFGHRGSVYTSMDLTEHWLIILVLQEEDKQFVAFQGEGRNLKKAPKSRRWGFLLLLKDCIIYLYTTVTCTSD